MKRIENRIERNLTQVFYDKASDHPSMVALRVLPSNEIWTFQQAAEEVNSWRAGLRSKFKKGDRVLILFQPGSTLFFFMLACFAEGVVPFLVDPRLSREHWRPSLSKANLKAFVSESKLLWLKAFFPEFRNVPSYVRSGWAPFSQSLNQLKLKNASYLPCIEHADDDVSFITLTSGTTGEPKLIHRNFGAVFEQQRLATKYLPKLEVDRHLAGYVVSVLQSLSETAESIYDTSKSLDAVEKSVNEWKINRLSGPPGYIMKIVRRLKTSRRQLPEIESVLVGGAPISRNYYLKCREVFPNASITIIYGATEVEPIAFTTNPRVSDWEIGYPVGKLMSELQVHRRSVPIFQYEDAFEVGVEGPHVVGRGIHWTGDIAVERNNQTYLLGRKSDLIRHEDRFYSTAPIEAQLEGEMGFGRIAIIQRVEGIRCFYDTADSNPDHDKLQSEVRKFLRSKGYNFRFEFTAVENVPVDARHEWKIQRRELK